MVCEESNILVAYVACNASIEIFNGARWSFQDLGEALQIEQQRTSYAGSSVAFTRSLQDIQDFVRDSP
jgi:hypothetical protein